MPKELSQRRFSTPFLFAFAVGQLLAFLAMVPKGFAQPVPGPGFNREVVDNNQQLQLQGSYSEARNGSSLLGVWRGATNNQVWMALDNGTPFTIGSTVTYGSPTVVPWGTIGFMVFHVGQDGGIYYAIVYTDGTRDSSWRRIPYQTTNESVAAVQMGEGEYEVYVVYRSSLDDNRIWGTWYDPGEDDAPGQGTWSSAEWIQNGVGLTVPSITLNPANNRLFVAVRGTNGNVWLTNQQLGAQGWNPWRDLGAYTLARPSIAALPNGRMVINRINNNFQGQFATFDSNGQQINNWVTDSVVISSTSIPLSLVNGVLIALYAVDYFGWWRVSPRQ